jgi:hypothetical protein
MKSLRYIAALAAPLALALTVVPASAAPTTAAIGAGAGAGKVNVQDLSLKQAAVNGVSADAASVIQALQSDPKLLEQLAANPAGGGALLRAHGATRSEQITVTPGGGGAQRTITITIKIDHVVITIEINL